MGKYYSVLVRPRLSIARMVWDLHYKGSAFSYSISMDGKHIVTFNGRSQNQGRTFCIGLGGSENDASYQQQIGDENLEEAFKFWLKELAKDGYERLSWECLRYDSKFHKILVKSGAEVIGSREVMRIFLRTRQHDMYFQSLSKHVRQNVRTAYNRVSREGHIIGFRVFSDEFGAPMSHLCLPWGEMCCVSV